MVPSTRENGIILGARTVLESKFGSMDPSMKATGKMTRQTVVDDLFTPMVISIMETGKTTRHMAMESIITLMAQNMKVNG